MKLILSLFTLLISTLLININQDKKLEESMERGAEIYQDFCVSCHMPNGLGVTGAFPPLAKSDFLMKKQTESIKAIKFGMQGEIIVNQKKYNSVMTPLGLTDDEIADVMNYITNTWGNKNDKMITEEAISKIKK